MIGTDVLESLLRRCKCLCNDLWKVLKSREPVDYVVARYHGRHHRGFVFGLLRPRGRLRGCLLGCARCRGILSTTRVFIPADVRLVVLRPATGLRFNIVVPGSPMMFLDFRPTRKSFTAETVDKRASSWAGLGCISCTRPSSFWLVSNWCLRWDCSWRDREVLVAGNIFIMVLDCSDVSDGSLTGALLRWWGHIDGGLANRNCKRITQYIRAGIRIFFILR